MSNNGMIFLMWRVPAARESMNTRKHVGRETHNSPITHRLPAMFPHLQLQAGLRTCETRSAPPSRALTLSGIVTRPHSLTVAGAVQGLAANVCGRTCFPIIPARKKPRRTPETAL
jgi:hypothetical protein